MPMSAEVTLLINLAILSVRVVLTEWLEGSWGPVSLKGDGGLSFCSQGIQRALLALESLPADSVISLGFFAHRRYRRYCLQLTVALWPERKHAEPSTLPFETFLLELWLHLVFTANAGLWARKVFAHGEAMSAYEPEEMVCVVAGKRGKPGWSLGREMKIEKVILGIRGRGYIKTNK